MTEAKPKQAWELAWEKEFPSLAATRAQCGSLSDAREWERAGFKYGYLAALAEKAT